MANEEPKVTATEGPAIPIVDVPHSGWTFDGAQIMLTLKTVRGDLVTFAMPTEKAEKVIFATQSALAGASKVRGLGGPAIGGEKPYEAQSIVFQASEDGRNAILVFEGTSGPSRHIQIDSKMLRALQPGLAKLERSMQGIRAMPRNRQ